MITIDKNTGFSDTHDGRVGTSYFSHKILNLFIDPAMCGLKKMDASMPLDRASILTYPSPLDSPTDFITRQKFSGPDNSSSDSPDSLKDDQWLEPASWLKSKILIVEDHPIAQTVAHTLISSLNCAVDVANQGIKAVQLTNEKYYDLIFMDIGLGSESIDGYSVTQQIRKTSLYNRNTPIIALTAHGGEENKKRCLEAGMDAVLHKPLTQAFAINILNTFIPARKLPTAAAPTPKRKDLPDMNQDLFQLEQYLLFDEQEAIYHSGDESVLNRMLSAFVDQEICSDLQLIEQAFAQNQWDVVEKIAHKIKGGALYMGTVRMRYACQYLERYCKTGETDLFIPLYKQCIHCIQETISFIKSWLEEKGY